MMMIYKNQLFRILLFALILLPFACVLTTTTLTSSVTSRRRSHSNHSDSSPSQQQQPFASSSSSSSSSASFSLQQQQICEHHHHPKNICIESSLTSLTIFSGAAIDRIEFCKNITTMNWTSSPLGKRHEQQVCSSFGGGGGDDETHFHLSETDCITKVELWSNFDILVGISFEISHYHFVSHRTTEAITKIHVGDVPDYHHHHHHHHSHQSSADLSCDGSLLKIKHESVLIDSEGRGDGGGGGGGGDDPTHHQVFSKIPFTPNRKATKTHAICLADFDVQKSTLIRPWIMLGLFQVIGTLVPVFERRELPPYASAYRVGSVNHNERFAAKPTFFVDDIITAWTCVISFVVVIVPTILLFKGAFSRISTQLFEKLAVTHQQQLRRSQPKKDQQQQVSNSNHHVNDGMKIVVSPCCATTTTTDGTLQQLQERIRDRIPNVPELLLFDAKTNSMNGKTWTIHADRLLGQGGFAQVFAASLTATAEATCVAAKVFRPTFHDQTKTSASSSLQAPEQGAISYEELMEAALREVALHVKLSISNNTTSGNESGGSVAVSMIPRITGVTTAIIERQFPTIVLLMEKADCSLIHFLKQQLKPGRPVEKRFPELNVKLIFNIAQQLAAILNHLHTEAKIVHCDLKPANVLLSFFCSGGRSSVNVKVTDFATAVSSDDDGGESQGDRRRRITSWTSAFVPPEILQHEEQQQGEHQKVDLDGSVSMRISPSFDVYSYGVILFQVLDYHRCSKSDLSNSNSLALLTSMITTEKTKTRQQLQRYLEKLFLASPQERKQSENSAIMSTANHEEEEEEDQKLLAIIVSTCAKCLSADVKDRFQNGKDLIDNLMDGFFAQQSSSSP